MYISSRHSLASVVLHHWQDRIKPFGRPVRPFHTFPSRQNLSCHHSFSAFHKKLSGIIMYHSPGNKLQHVPFLRTHHAVLFLSFYTQTSHCLECLPQLCQLLSPLDLSMLFLLITSIVFQLYCTWVSLGHSAYYSALQFMLLISIISFFKWLVECLVRTSVWIISYVIKGGLGLTRHHPKQYVLNYKGLLK